MESLDGEKLKQERVLDAISASSQLAKHKSKLDKLTKKHDELEELMTRLSAVVKNAEREKHQVIDDYCNDKCTSEDLETAKRVYDKSVYAEERNTKLVTTLNTKINNLNEGLHDLREKKLTTEKLVWESLSDEINEHLKKMLGDMILWAYAVNRQRPTPMLYDEFLQTVVFPKPGAEDMKHFALDLKALYEKTMKE